MRRDTVRTASEKEPLRRHYRSLIMWLDFPSVRPRRMVIWQDWVAAAVLFIVSALVRLTFLLWMRGDASLESLVSKWDGRIYLAIAKYGYFSDVGGAPDPEVYQTRLAFFPGYPGLIAAVHSVTRLNYVTSALVISYAAGIVMTAGVMAMAARMGANRRLRLCAAMLVLGAPMSTTFTMVYTESVFLACAVWALVAMTDKRWLLAGAFTFCAGFFRLTAVDLVAAFAVVVAVYAARNWRAWAAVAVSMLPLVSYLFYASSYTRDIGGYFGLQTKGWHSTFDFGRATVIWVSTQLREGNNVGYLLSIASIVGAIGAVIVFFRRLPLAYWLFGAAVTANIVLSDGIMHSRPRLLLPAVVLLLPIIFHFSQRRYALPAVATCWLLFGAWFSAYMIAVFEWAI
ncbi:hypothetical protein O7746_03855 [Corynebacterium pseudotuberculosis]|nr:hypothetical protein [Corynebacterium pseudotuberculosis]